MTILEWTPVLLMGLKTTVCLTLGGLGVGLVSAILAGLARLSANPLLRWPAAAYVEIFRGTSALVQLFWVYFALPLMGIRIEAFAAGIWVLGLNTGAYGAEIVRGAVLAVPREQTLAAQALNFSPRQTLWRIVFPQALLAMVPPAGNLAIELLKNTALVSMITLADLTFQAQTLRAATLDSTSVFSFLLLIYFLLAQMLHGGFRALEHRLAWGRDTGGLRP